MPVVPPSPTVRQAPTGRRIPDGFITYITFASQPALGVWEVKAKPKGGDGGEPIDISTMHNVRFHTMYPRSLVKHTDSVTSCGIDPDAISLLDTQLDKPDTITTTFPDGTSDAYYGYLQKYEFTEFSIGEFPMVNLTIMPMNYDATNNNEQGPVYSPAAGT